MKEALFYEKLDGGKVKCTLCPHYCVLVDGKVGFCGVRKNNEGVLETLIYGKVSSMAADPIEKKPLYNFKPATLVFSMGTLGCNMHCGHCQNWEISHVILAQAFDSEKMFAISNERQTEYVSPEDAVQMALDNDCEGMAWTYNEPTIWFEYTLDCAKIAKQKGLYTVYVTNGYINPEPLDMIAPYLDAYRVDLKGFTNDFYKKVAKVPSFEPVLESSIRAKKKWGMHVEIVTNIIPTLNDDEKQLTDIAVWIKENLGKETPWHVTKFTPCLEYKDLSTTPEETLEIAHDIGKKAGLEYVYIGNVYGHQYENTYCPNCASLIIERQGFEVVNMDIESGKCPYCLRELSIRL